MVRGGAAVTVANRTSCTCDLRPLVSGRGSCILGRWSSGRKVFKPTPPRVEKAMPWFETVANLHMHTPYSDGAWSHAQIAEAALAAGLDCVCVTDHNVWVKGPARYYAQGDRRVLLLIGEEIHDQTRVEQKNHLLVYGAEQELARQRPPEPRGAVPVHPARGAPFTPAA
jgi:hypothetical protein